jgi:DNA-binding NarL/FixJ family response regulator
MSESVKLSILVADDHPLVRAGIVTALEHDDAFQVVAQAGTGAEVLQLLLGHEVQVLLLDLKMPGTETHQLISKCREIQPDLKVLIFSAHTDAKSLLPLRAAGVQGFIQKEDGPANLLQAVRTVASGLSWYSPGVREKLNRSVAELSVSLTPRERDVLEAIGRALDNQTIAERLGISKETVRRNLTNLYAKLGVKNRIEAMLWQEWQTGG